MVDFLIAGHKFMDQKLLNCTLAVDLPLQTLAVDFSSYLCRLALPLCTPETLFSLSKLKISLFNVHLALFVRRMKQLRSFNPIRTSLSKLTLELALEVRALSSPLADQTTTSIVAELGMNVNKRSSA